MEINNADLIFLFQLNYWNVNENISYDQLYNFICDFKIPIKQINRISNSVETSSKSSSIHHSPALKNKFSKNSSPEFFKNKELFSSKIKKDPVSKFDQETYFSIKKKLELLKKTQ